MPQRLAELAKVACPVRRGLCNAAASNLLLLLSGDVETNRGLDDCPQKDPILEALQRIELGQVKVLEEIKDIRDKQANTDRVVRELSLGMTTLEREVSLVR